MSSFEIDRWEEVRGGVLVKMEPVPFTPHQTITHNIYDALRNSLSNKNCKVYGSGVGVNLTINDNFVPDIMIIKDLTIIKSNGIEGVPDFIAEVVNPISEEADRGYKKEIYEKSGVKEYWIVTPETKSIEIYHLNSGKFRLNRICRIYDESFFNVISNEERKVIETEQNINLKIFENIQISITDIFV